MSNTIVTASDSNYIWGVWLLLSSMRKNGMNNPVIVLAHKYSDHDKIIIKQFDNVRIIDHDTHSSRNLTCSKPSVMLEAETDYVTWVDCDAIFIGNCAQYLTPDEDHIHIRMRALKENYMVFEKYYADNEGRNSGIPVKILDVWHDDIREKDTPAISTCASACFMSLHTKHREFLEKWREQILKVLPDDNVGVVDRRSSAYFQTDESVLNSVMCFSNAAPPPTDTYKLDKDPKAYFVHFVLQPKPWQMWNSYTARHFDKTVDIVEWAIANGIKPPSPVPFSLKRKYKIINMWLAPLGKNIARVQKVLGNFK